MFVFIDESGCSGFKFRNGSSKYFVIGSVLVNSKEKLEEYDQKIQNLKFTISPDFKEFHFAPNKDRTRQKFLELITTLELEIFVLVVPKSKLKSNNFRIKKSFYKCLFGYAINNYSNKLENSNVILDRCSGDTFEKEVAKSLEKKFSTKVNIQHQCSERTNLLQIADYLASVTRYYAEKPESKKYKKFYEMISSKIKYVQVWP